MKVHQSEQFTCEFSREELEVIAALAGAVAGGPGEYPLRPVADRIFYGLEQAGINTSKVRVFNRGEKTARFGAEVYLTRDFTEQ